MASVIPAGAAKRLVIGITGHIAAKCEIRYRGAAALSFGDVLDQRTGRATAASLNLPFHLMCNAPYTAVLSSKNGGLAFDGLPAEGFSSLIGYRAEIGLARNAGGLSLNCASDAMRAAGDIYRSKSSCAATSRGGDFNSGDGSVQLTLAGTGQPLLKGIYTDELVLTVSPDL